MGVTGKMYLGNPPNEAGGWLQIGSCEDADGVEWLLYGKNQDHNPEWWTYKVVADGRAKGKANYWFGHHVKTGRISYSRDAMLLETHRPELHEKIRALILISQQSE
jgi:hypothetical protein